MPRGSLQSSALLPAHCSPGDCGASKGKTNPPAVGWNPSSDVHVWGTSRTLAHVGMVLHSQRKSLCSFCYSTARCFQQPRVGLLTSGAWSWLLTGCSSHLGVWVLVEGDCTACCLARRGHCSILQPDVPRSSAPPLRAASHLPDYGCLWGQRHGDRSSCSGSWESELSPGQIRL